MTEEKKLPTIEEWFEENKNENDCAGMTIEFTSRMQSTLDDSVNYELKKYFSSKIYHEHGKGNAFNDLNFTLEIVLSKDENGKIVYFIDESRVELV